MADFYVRSTDGDDASDGLSWANAKATLQGAFSAASAGDRIFVSQAHAQTQASSLTLTSPGTQIAPVRVYCVDDSSGEPATTHATGGSVSVTGNNAMTFAGCCYVRGLTFNVGSGGSNSSQFNLNSTSFWWKFEDCALKLLANATNANFNFGVQTAAAGRIQFIELVNTALTFTHSGSQVNVACDFQWRNTPSAIQGTMPTVLFVPSGSPVNGTVVCEGVEFPQTSGDLIDNGTANSNCQFILVRCKFGSGLSLTTDSAPQGAATTRVVAIDCGSDDANYHYRRVKFTGLITDETTIVRTGGASDGTTTLSRKAVTNARPTIERPLELDQVIAVWIDSTGSSKTITLETLTDNVTLTDADAWLEVDYKATSGSSRSSLVSGRADPLGTPTNHTSSSESWTTTGLTTPVKQKLSVSFTPQEKGYALVRVCVAVPSTTVYVDPKAAVA